MPISEEVFLSKTDNGYVLLLPNPEGIAVNVEMLHRPQYVHRQLPRPDNQRVVLRRQQWLPIRERGVLLPPVTGL